MGTYYHCYGCGRTAQSLQKLRSHTGRCFWYRWFKANDIIDQAPFHPNNLAASLEFMRGEEVDASKLVLRYPTNPHGLRADEYR